MSSTCVSVRVCSPEPKICERPLSRQRLSDQVRDRVRDPRLVGIRQLTRPVGVERAADRVAQSMLVMRRARVDLAGELREPVCRAGRRAAVDVALCGRKLGRALEHHRRGNVDKPPHVALDGGVDDRARERVVHLGQRERELVEVRDPTDDRRQVDHVLSSRRAPRGRPRGRAGRRSAAGSSAHPRRAPGDGHRRGLPSPDHAAAAGRPRCRSSRRRPSRAPGASMRRVGRGVAEGSRGPATPPVSAA